MTSDQTVGGSSPSGRTPDPRHDETPARGPQSPERNGSSMSAKPSNSHPTAVATWLSELRATRRSPRTIQTYQYATDGFLAWLSDERPVCADSAEMGQRVIPAGSAERPIPVESAEIGQPDADRLLSVTKREATAYVAWLTATYRPGGNECRVRSLRCFYNWAIAEGEYTGVNPFARLMPQGEDKVMAVPSDDDVAAMLKRAKDGPSRRDLAVLQILIRTGCRKGEIAALTIDDLDFDNRLISFRVSKTRARVVPMHDDVVVALGRWMRSRSDRDGLWNSTAPYDLVDTIVVRASEGLWRAHALRRYFAVNWMQRGGSEASLIRLCGWKDGTMLRHYIAARADEIADDEYRRLMD